MPLTADKALKMVQAAHAKAAEFNVRIAVAVVDQGGHLVALGRMDGSSFLNNDAAYAMAYTSAGFGTSGSNVLRFADAAWFRSLVVQSGGRVTAADGGLPIRENGVTIGGVGVSGASDEQDKAIAQAAVDAFNAP